MVSCTDYYDTLDAGYAWVIMVASIFGQFLVSGSFATLGIFYVEYLEYFGENPAFTSWVPAIMLASSGFTGEYFG